MRYSPLRCLFNLFNTQSSSISRIYLMSIHSTRAYMTKLTITKERTLYKENFMLKIILLRVHITESVY